MSVDLTSQFVFPQAALEDIAERGGLKLQKTHQFNVQQYAVGDFDKGIAYEFFTHQAPNDMASQEFDMELTDDVEMIRWIVTPRKLEPVCRVTDLPPQLLKFRKVPAGKNNDNQTIMKHFRDENGDLECTGGLYKESYLRWKKGQRTPGTPLDKWNKATDSEIKTLMNEGIFSVQQFASISEERIRERFPKVFWERHKEAIRFVNAENPAVSLNEIKKYADQLQEERAEKSKLLGLVETLSSRLEALEKQSAPVSVKKRGRQKKSEAQPSD